MSEDISNISDEISTIVEATEGITSTVNCGVTNAIGIANVQGTLNFVQGSLNLIHQEVSIIKTQFCQKEKYQTATPDAHISAPRIDPKLIVDIETEGHTIQPTPSISNVKEMIPS
ncbi:10070_t:CDS:2 [Scutellospora calospora]|uniref:10070_t:CDS:1 n=1 Tax=Scutellospora calospora TaxID=85575 RepID=A0ACA9K858_9GLOM|nr:10070_t:CDS:2 [Scutellospora calospora]